MKHSLFFESVSYRNFHSTGNSPVVIDLQKSSTTLIYGKNGAGKSTVYEALYFGLFGKSFRKSTKPELVNNINKKRLLIDVKFKQAGNDYLVRRGMIPNIFEIYKNGHLIDQGALIRDYQKMLEKNILGFSSKAFAQVVILGSLHYVPYMRLSLKDRREIIEELLDIQIFSQMNVFTKSDISEINLYKSELNQEKNLVQTALILHEKHIEDLQQNTEGLRLRQADEIKELEHNRTKLLGEKDTYEQNGTRIDNDFVIEMQASISKWQKYSTVSNMEQKSIAEELIFFQANDDCNKCHQTITADFKTGFLSKLESRLTELKSADIKIQTNIDNFNNAWAEIEKTKSFMAEIKTNIALVNSDIASVDGQILRIKTKLEEKLPDDKISDLKKQLGTCRSKKTRISNKQILLTKEYDELEFILKLLKDDGIKSNIIKYWIPVINKLISKYLLILGFPIKFSFDENFKEHIVIKGRKDLAYSSFSAGEKMRVDLALLFAFREIPIMRSGQGTNLLIFDEVADSAMDTDGWDAFLSIIESLSGTGNVFVISPRGDQLVDKFANSIEFIKKASFSEVNINA